MKQEEFMDLVAGDKVLFKGADDADMAPLPPVGTILVRRDTWLDDERSVNFKWCVDGVSDHHFFHADEVDFIKE